MSESNRVKFITAKDEQGKLILEYFNKTCQQALNYCQNNNLQSYEDFAQTIKVIGNKNAQAKGEHLSIRVGIKKDDLVISLANRPQSGATKSIKMLEHLGKEKKYQYTRPKVEELLQKNQTKINSEFNSKELSDFSSSINDGDNLTERGGKENSRLNHLYFIDEQSNFDETERTDNKPEITDDLLFEEEKSKAHEDAIKELLNDSLKEKEDNSNKKTQSNTEIKSKAAKKKTQQSNASSSIANRGSKTLMSLAHKADSYTQNTDGMTVIAASLRMGAVGVALANKLLESKDEKKLNKTIDRILAVQEKSDRVLERSKSLEIKANQEKSKTNSEELDFDDELDINGRIPLDNQLDENEDLDFGDELDVEKDISRQLGKAVDTIDKQLQDIDPDTPSEPIIIDRDADFDQQLAQINAALDRLEQKLDSLEKRIERLEQSLEKQQESISNSVVMDEENSADIWYEDDGDEISQEIEELDSEDDSDVLYEDNVDEINQEIEELDSENNSDIINEDEINQQAEIARELDNNLVNTLLQTSIKYKQINPDSDSEIPIGDNCKLCTGQDGATGFILIQERNGDEVLEIFKTTLDYNTSQYFIDKDELSTEEKQSIVESFGQRLEEIDAFLALKQEQSNSNEQKRKPEMSLD